MKLCQNPMEHSGYAIERLSSGILLVSADGEVVNPMAIAWGFLGYQWSKPVFIAPVRTSRFSHPIIAKTRKFTVCVQPEEMDEVKAYCGQKSGRDVDKIKELGLTTTSLGDFDVPVIDGCKLAYLCNVIHTASAEPLSNHEFFFGEVSALYSDM